MWRWTTYASYLILHFSSYVMDHLERIMAKTLFCYTNLWTVAKFYCALRILHVFMFLKQFNLLFPWCSRSHTVISHTYLIMDVALMMQAYLSHQLSAYSYSIPHCLPGASLWWAKSSQPRRPDISAVHNLHSHTIHSTWAGWNIASLQKAIWTDSESLKVIEIFCLVDHL